jgi:hypothetical protein
MFAPTKRRRRHPFGIVKYNLDTHPNLYGAERDRVAIYVDNRIERSITIDLRKSPLFPASFTNDELTIMFGPNDNPSCSVLARIGITTNRAIGKGMMPTQ